MKTDSEARCLLRNGRSTWVVLASLLAICGLPLVVQAQSITESSNAPTANVLLENLTGGSTSGSPGATSHDYLNNPPPGELFTLGGSALLGYVTVRGNGDAGYFNGTATVPLPTDSYHIEIGSVSGTTITPILTNTIAAFTPSVYTDYLTFKLSTPVSLTAGTKYSFSIYMDSQNAVNPQNLWFGLQESLTHSFDLSDGGAFNNGSSTSTFGNTVVANPLGYSYVFVLQAVPEPTTLALIGLGGLGLLAAKRRQQT